MWYGVDPLIEDYPAWSSFNYVMGNPIRLIDPDGRSPRNGGNPLGSSPHNVVGAAFGRYFQTAGALVDKIGAKVEAFFSFGTEKSGTNGGVSGSVSNETKTSVTVKTRFGDFFTQNGNSNEPVSRSPIEVKVETTNVNKTTSEKQVSVRGLTVNFENETCQNTTDCNTSNTSTVTVGRGKNGVFLEKSDNNVSGGVKVEVQATTNQGQFVKVGGSLKVGE